VSAASAARGCVTLRSAVPLHDLCIAAPKNPKFAGAQVVVGRVVRGARARGVGGGGGASFVVVCVSSCVCVSAASAARGRVALRSAVPLHGLCIAAPKNPKFAGAQVVEGRVVRGARARGVGGGGGEAFVVVCVTFALFKTKTFKTKTLFGGRLASCGRWATACAWGGVSGARAGTGGTEPGTGAWTGPGTGTGTGAGVGVCVAWGCVSGARAGAGGLVLIVGVVRELTGFMTRGLSPMACAWVGVAPGRAPAVPWTVPVGAAGRPALRG